MNKYVSYCQDVKRCTLCKNEGLIFESAIPLFMKEPIANYDILFISEAPNLDDTVNTDKQFLTVSADTDPSGQFTNELFNKHLRSLLNSDPFVTNAVLCLPQPKNGKFPVNQKLKKNCSMQLKRLIDDMQPKIVCTVGAVALNAVKSIEKHVYSDMKSAVANPISWYGRILYPLYHTSLLGRMPHTGRIAPKQHEDWAELAKLYKTL